MGNAKALVFIPTYNEKENVEKIYSEIVGLKLGLDFLFLDDNSPDGTGTILGRMAGEHREISVIHRDKKSGIGSAHLTGIKWAYQHGYEKLITMDCDFTHLPEYIPLFIDYSCDYDVVIGTRFKLKESMEGWSCFRKLITNAGHILTRYLLRMPYDASGAYRLYRLDKIPLANFDLVMSSGYAFFFESLYILNMRKFRTKEVPIILPARSKGHSKMDFKEAQKGILYLFYFAFKVFFRHKL